MAIHWWDTNTLAEELRRGEITEQQSLLYAIFSAVIATAGLYYAYWFGGDRGWPLFLEFAAVCAISVIGLYECFKANGGNAGSHFLSRLWCLGVPLGLKLAIAGVMLGQAISFIAPRLTLGLLFRDPYFVYQLLSLFVAGAMTVVYYWRMAFHLARVARTADSDLVAQSISLPS